MYRRADPGAGRSRRGTTRPRRRRLVAIAVGAVVAAALLGPPATLAAKVVDTADRAFEGDAFDAVLGMVAPPRALETDGSGNITVLLLGTTEDLPGHPGAELTDTMMILSINERARTSFLLSVPRDLWVDYGRTCSGARAGKVNAVYGCERAAATGTAEQREREALRATGRRVGRVMGLDVADVVHVNGNALRRAVDAVGGITVTIDSPDPRGVYDRSRKIRLPNGPVRLDGAEAAALARARNASGGYGLVRSDFDREDYQRKIVAAVGDKAMRAGFLADPLQVIQLLDAMGDNVRTTVDASEMKSLVGLLGEIRSGRTRSVDILRDRPGVLTTGRGPDGSSIVRPTAGLEDYAQLRSFTRELLAAGR